MHIDLSFVSRFRYTHTIMWALLLSVLIVGVAATIGRATVNLRGALTAEDASLAVMILLPDEEISDITLIKASVEEQEFLAETKTGPKLIRVKRGEKHWYVSDSVTLHENQ